MRCEVVKEESRRKEVGLIQELKNKANQLKELKAKRENNVQGVILFVKKGEKCLLSPWVSQGS